MHTAADTLIANQKSSIQNLASQSDGAPACRLDFLHLVDSKSLS